MSMFQKIENRSEWEDLLSKTFFKTFFHTLEWETFLEREFFWIKFERYVWRDKLLLSIARCRLFGKEKLVSHPFCEYGGPLPLKKKVDWEGFNQDFKKEFGDRARIKFHPYILCGLEAGHCFSAHSRPASAGLRGSGWFSPPSADTMLNQPSNPQKNNALPPMQPISTYWIDNFSKKSPEDLWNNFRKTLKQEIKRGEGLMGIRECQSESELRQFYGIYLRTVKRHKNIPLPFSIFQFLFNGSGAKIFLAKNKNEAVGGSVFLFYPPFIHYFISASDEGLRDLNIGHKILWHVIHEYVGHRKSHIKYDYFDLGGTRKGSALEVFKRGWGAKEIPIYNIPIFSRILEYCNARSGSNVRNILGLMPAPIMSRAAKYTLWFKA